MTSTRRRLSHEGWAPDPSPFDIHEYKCRSFLETLNEQNVQRNFEEAFLEIAELSTPSPAAQIIRDFCCSDVRVPTSLQQPRIKIEDREFVTNKRRNHSEDVTVVQLPSLIQDDRYSVSDRPAADLRQIWVQNVTPEVFWILARSCHVHQVEPLQDALAKHVSGKTSIKIHQRVADINEFSSPRLELHLPYLTLRRHIASHESAKSCDRWANLLFPKLHARRGGPMGQLVIEEAHISIMFSVWDKSKWLALAFHKPGGAQEEEDDYDIEGTSPDTDIFTPDNLFADPLRNHTIQDPRELYLHLMDPWVYLVWREYDNVVQTVNANIEEWRRATQEPFTDPTLLDQVLDEAGRAMELVRKIQHYLAPLLSEWRDFINSNGYIEHFHCIMDEKAKRRLSNTEGCFRDLIKLDRTLELLGKECERFAHKLQTCKQMESQSLTIVISREMRMMIRRSTDMARTNGALLGLNNPLLLALQYFGAQKPIFPSVAQNPRNFVITILILGVITAILTYILGYLDAIWVSVSAGLAAVWSFIKTRIPARKGERPAKPDPLHNSSDPLNDPVAIEIV